MEVLVGSLIKGFSSLWDYIGEIAFANIVIGV